MSTASPQYVTIATAAERLSVSEKSVRRWISQGELPAGQDRKDALEDCYVYKRTGRRAPPHPRRDAEQR